MKCFQDCITIYIFNNIKVQLLMDEKIQNLSYLESLIVSD